MSIQNLFDTAINGLSLLELISSAANPMYHSNQYRIALCERDAQQERLTIILNVCFILSEEIHKGITERFVRNSGYEPVRIQKLWFSNQGSLLLQPRGISLVELNPKCSERKYHPEQHRLESVGETRSARQILIINV